MRRRVRWPGPEVVLLSFSLAKKIAASRRQSPLDAESSSFMFLVSSFIHHEPQTSTPGETSMLLALTLLEARAGSPT